MNSFIFYSLEGEGYSLKGEESQDITPSWLGGDLGRFVYDDQSHSHIIVARVEKKRMVRFKNRYILADISNMELPEAPTERVLLKLIK